LPHGNEPIHDFNTSITCVGYWRTGRCTRGRGITSPRLVELLTSSEFLSFIRTVTGDDSIGWVSANATLYKPLDFLDGS
jgi:hypothetical protein